MDADAEITGGIDMRPDKIYVNPDLDCPWTDEGCFGDVEYIRKDALLEWAKENQYKSLTIVADNFWQEVIDKINSL